jgi:hypothetical protein
VVVFNPEVDNWLSTTILGSFPPSSILKCLPELESLETLYSPVGIYKYYDCTNFLANVIALCGGSRAAGLVRLCQVANEKLGVSVAVRGCGHGLGIAVPVLRCWGAERGFDLHLLVNSEELRVWKQPQALELLVPVTNDA